MEEYVYYKGYKIKIMQDEFAESPDDWEDEDLFLIYDHRSFTVKRKGFEPIDIYESGLAYEKKYWIFPVEAYIHSGVHLSLFSGTKQYMWDSSVSGYILASKEKFEDLGIATNAAEGLIETWNQYLSGDVWGFIVEKPNTVYSITKEDFDTLITTGMFTSDNFLKVVNIEDEWEEVDSCWGFYEQEAAINEAKLVIDNLIKELE